MRVWQACLLAAMFGLAPASSALAANPPPARHACDVVVDVDDLKDAHVRASPAGKVLAALDTPGDDWIEVHVVAQVGDWYEIDRAILIDDDAPSGQKLLFRGAGFMHRKELGVSGLINGVPIYSDHDAKSRPVIAEASGNEPVEMLGCWGGFLKVRLKQGEGWTDSPCTNTKTTCP